MDSDEYNDKVYGDGKNQFGIGNNFQNERAEIRIVKALVIDYDEVNKTPKFSLLVEKDYYTFTSIWSNIDPFSYKPQNYKIESLHSVYIFQKLIYKFLLYSNNAESRNADLEIQSFPLASPKFESSSNDDIFNNIIPTIFSISYIAILFQFVLWIVKEKEAKLDEFLYRQGISKTQYFVSWIYTFVLLMIIPILLNTFLLSFYLFPKTHLIILFINNFLFSINIIALALVFNQLVSSLRSGQAFLRFFYIGVSILGIPATKETTHPLIRMLFVIFPQTVLKMSFEILLETKVNY